MEWTDSLEHVSDIEKKVSVKIPSASIEAAVEKALKKYSTSANLKGFRPGKAPRQMIEKMYGPSIRYEAVTGLVDQTFQEVIKKNSFSVLGEPKVEFSPTDESKEIAYTAQFYVYPKPTITNFDSFNIKATKQIPTKAEIDEVVDRIVQSKATVKPVEGRDTIADGDIVAGEIEIIVEGQESERPEPLIVKLGTKAIPEELEKALIGSKTEQTISVNLVIPEDHRDETLRGKSAEYKATVRSIYAEDKPELTDEFVASLGGDEKTVAELIKSVEERMNKEYEERSFADIDREIVRELIKRNPFIVPPMMIDDEVRAMARKQKVLRKEGSDEEFPIEELRSQFAADAEERVKAAIVIDSLLEAEKLHVDSDELNKHMEELSEKLGIGLAEVKKFFQQENRMVELFVDQSRQKVLAFLRAKAKIEYA